MIYNIPLRSIFISYKIIGLYLFLLEKKLNDEEVVDDSDVDVGDDDGDKDSALKTTEK